MSCFSKKTEVLGCPLLRNCFVHPSHLVSNWVQVASCDDLCVSVDCDLHLELNVHAAHPRHKNHSLLYHLPPFGSLALAQGVGVSTTCEKRRN